jgi:hypothetical protein
MEDLCKGEVMVMDRGTKIIIIIASIGLLLMLISLGHDLFSKKSSSPGTTQSSVSQIQGKNTAFETIS